MRVRSALVLLTLGLGIALAVTPRVVAATHPPSPETQLTQLTAGWDKGAPRSVTDLRTMNPEYDFMARTFLVLALADRALAHPEEAASHTASMDAILRDTIGQEADRGQLWWLLPYAHGEAWEGSGRSLFVDGEVLVMLGARRLVADDAPHWTAEMERRVARVLDNLGSTTGLPIAESYPDEGWTFCHTMALLGLRMHEVLDGATHRATITAFTDFAEAQLIHTPTGLLNSEFSMDGTIHDGPEGSSIWFTVTALEVLAPTLGRQQYDLARRELGRTLLGMGYAREWPVGHANHQDVDSGPLVPGLEASASSSGFAIAASRAYRDAQWNGELLAALGAAEAIMAVDPWLAAAADNPVGQAVVLWGLGFGPVWARLGAPDAHH
jgi:hypothetical protein